MIQCTTFLKFYYGMFYGHPLGNTPFEVESLDQIVNKIVSDRTSQIARTVCHEEIQDLIVKRLNASKTRKLPSDQFKRLAGLFVDQDREAGKHG